MVGLDMNGPQERLICGKHGVVAHTLREGWSVCVPRIMGHVHGTRWVTHPQKPEGCYLCKSEREDG